MAGPRPGTTAAAVIRGGGRVLGARRDGADARGIGRTRSRNRRSRSCAPQSRGTCPTARSGAGSSRVWRTARPREGAPGDQENLFSAWRLFFERSPTSGRRSSCLKTSSGPTRVCSISSSTCSTGRGATRSSCWRGPAGARRSARPRRQRSFTSIRSSRCRDGRWRLLDGLVPGLPASFARGSSSGPRACRSMRSRRSGCCSIAACSTREGDGYARRARSSSSTCRRPCTRWWPRDSTGLGPRSAAWVECGAVLGKTFTKQGLAAVSGVGGGGARTVARRARAQGGALASRPTRARPSAASTRSSRTSCRHVAYETLSKRERKAKHLAAAQLPRVRVGARTRTRSSRSIADALPRRLPRRTG